MSDTLAQGKRGWERPIAVLALAALLLVSGYEGWCVYKNHQSPWLSDIARKYDPVSNGASGHLVIPLTCSQYPGVEYGKISFDINTKTGRWYPVQQIWRPDGWQCPQGPVQQGAPQAQPQKK